MFKDRSKILFVSSLISTAYVIYMIVYFWGSSSDLGGVIATAVVTPHLLMMGLGAVFSWIGFFTRATWAALVAAILYCVGALIFLLYIIFTIPSIVFGFIGYANQRKINLSK